MMKNMIKFGIYSKIALKLNSNPKFIQFLIVFLMESSLFILSYFNAEASDAMPLHSRFTQNFLIRKKENSLLNKNLFILNRQI